MYSPVLAFIGIPELGMIAGIAVILFGCKAVSQNPSVGKSLFLQGEAVNFIEQGKRVHYLTLGDLNELDMAIRMTCMMARQPKRVIESDILGFYDLYQNKFSNYLGLTVVPSGYVKVSEYVEWMIQMADSYDILKVIACK